MKLALLLTLLAAPAAAAPSLNNRALDDGALASVRGGYVAAPGLSFDFGAEISTYVDNRLVMQSRLSLSDAGLTTEQTGVGGGDPFVSIPGQGGDTRVMQLIDPGRLGSVVLNTASNRDIRQDTAITMVVPGLADLQQQIGLQKLGSQLNAAASTGAMSRIGR